MKKQIIPNLGRIIGKAVIVAAMACPILFSSCDKFIFDDSELKESIQDLYERISTLEERVSNEVAALTSIINGKVTVLSVDPQSDGSTVVTLSNGQTFTVGADVTGSSFLTTVEEGGVLYWAVTVAGGDTQALLVDGKKVPVTVTPAVKLEDGKWMVSVDGGKTWIDTGIEQEEEVVFFTAVTEDDDYAYITLASGETVKVAKEKEVSFAILSGKQYFTAGETKYVKLEMNGVKDYTITEKPDGWKASIADGRLKVTAPASLENVDSEGLVKVLATFENESPIIAKVAVTLNEADFTIALNGENVIFTLAAKNVDNWNYEGYVTGIMPYSQFSAEAACEYFSNNTSFKWGAEYYNSFTTTISALAGESYDPEEAYVVFASNWCSPYDDATYSAEDLQYVVYLPVKIDVTITPSLDNAIVKVTFSGCDGFYAGCDEKQWWDPENYLYDLGSMWGPSVCKTAYEGAAGLICGGWNTTLKIDTEYVFWVVPYDESGNYSVESFTVYEFSTKSLSLGGSYAKPEISLTQDPTYNQIAVKVTTVKGAYKTYARIFTKDEVPADELELVQKLVAQGTGKTDAEENFQINRTYLDPGTEIVIAAVAIGNDGAAGEVATLETSTQKLLYSDNLKVTPEVVTLGMTNVTIKLTLEGPVTSIRYVNTYDTYGVDTMEDKLAQKSRYDLVTVDVATLTDNTIELSNLTLGYNYTFYVMGEDADGNLSHMSTVAYTPSSDIVYIRQSSDDWAYGKPSISNETWGPDPWVWIENTFVPSRTGWYSQNTTLDVDLTLPADCKKVYCLIDQPEYHNAKTELSMSDWVVANGKEYTESSHIQEEYANETTSIWLVWVDSNDKYHTFDLYTPTFPEKPTEAPATGE
ncbi:MAG: PL29 family lyase N-terminal domain-containing protein [Candidatus Cryptobacteroides sp.]